MAKKSEKILEIILTIIHDPRQMISAEKLASLVTEDKSEKTLYRWKKELVTEELFKGYAPLKEIKEGETTYYALNSDLFQYFVPEHLETPYLLDAYGKLGYLFKNARFEADLETLKKDVLQLNGKSSELKRKFHYLSKVRGHNPNHAQENLQTKVVAALIHNKVIAAQYHGKLYPRLFPLCLCQYRDALYLIAYKEEMKEENLRHFKLTRLESLMETKETFTYPTAKVWNPEEHFRDSSGIITGDAVCAHIRVYGHSRDLILEKDFFTGTLTEQTPNYDGYVVKYTNVREFLGQIFVYAQDVEIVGPPTLQEEFMKKAEGAMKRNGKLKAA